MTAPDATVLAAVVAAIVSLVGAFVAWWKERSVVGLKQALDTSTKSYEHVLGLEAARLKAELEAGVISHEVRERLRTDLLLRILVQDEERVAKQREVFGDCLRRCNETRLMLNEEERSREALDKIAEIAGILSQTGFLLPPEVFNEAKAVEQALRTLAAPTQVADLVRLFEQHQGAVLDRLDEFDGAVRTWRETARHALLTENPKRLPPRAQDH